MSKRVHSDESGSPEDSRSSHEAQLISDVVKRVEYERESRAADVKPVIICSFPPICNHRPRNFYELDEFESHYQKYHCHICHECLANFPSSYFLDLHIEEVHNPIFLARLDRGELVYRCFTEHCPSFFISKGARQRHLLDQHSYPPEFRFNIVTQGLRKNTQSLLFAPRVSYATKAAQTNQCSIQGLHEESQMADVVETDASEPKLNRAQRRAQAKEQEIAGNMESEIDLGQEKPNKNPKAVAIEAKKAHAEAVRALFQTHTDQEILVTNELDNLDHEMEDLISTIRKVDVVPKQIRFGNKGR